MCANKRFRLTYAAALVFCLTAASHLQAQDNSAQQLEELKRALQAPSAEPKPRRTRAIVFDNAPQASGTEQIPRTSEPQAQQAQQLPSVSEPVAARPQQSVVDCRQLVIRNAGGNGKSVPFAIQFAGGSAEISPVSRELLGSIGGLLTNMLDGRCVVIEGHTDVSGNYERNIELSHARANSVAFFLMQNYGINSRSVVTSGKGPNEILPGVDPKNPRNRRVVFRIVS